MSQPRFFKAYEGHVPHSQADNVRLHFLPPHVLDRLPAVGKRLGGMDNVVAKQVPEKTAADLGAPAVSDGV